MSQENENTPTKPNPEAEQTTPEAVDKQQLAQRWSEMGLAIKSREEKLALSEQQIKKQVDQYTPKDASHLEKAEEILKNTKDNVRGMSDYRKEVTSKLDQVKDRLSSYEKSASEHVKQLENAIISIKKERERKQKAERERTEQKKKLEGRIQGVISKEKQRIQGVIEDYAQKAYSYALDKEMQPDELEDYFARIDERLYDVDGLIEVKEYIPREELDQVSKEELDLADKQIEQAVMQMQPKKVCMERIRELFEGYESALKDKEAAKQRAEEERQKRDKEAQEEAQREQAAADLKQGSHSDEDQQQIEEGGKPLKKSFEIDMEETEENAMLLLRAYVANQERCRKHVRTKKWFGFSADNAGKALSKEKSRDNDFQPEGITFKEVDKL